MAWRQGTIKLIHHRAPTRPLMRLRSDRISCVPRIRCAGSRVLPLPTAVFRCVSSEVPRGVRWVVDSVMLEVERRGGRVLDRACGPRRRTRALGIAAVSDDGDAPRFSRPRLPTSRPGVARPAALRWQAQRVRGSRSCAPACAAAVICPQGPSASHLHLICAHRRASAQRAHLHRTPRSRI